MHSRIAALLATLASLLLLAGSAAPARAGVLTKQVDIVFATPFLGAEYAHFAFAGTDASGSLATKDFPTTGFTFGGVAGVRLGPISLGALYQRTQADAPANQTIGTNKLYGELAFNAQMSIVNLVLHLDFGWAFINVDKGADVEGFGGKLGAALDIYPTSWLSIGPGAAFDLQAYSTNKGLSGAYGGTFVARIGFHL